MMKIFNRYISNWYLKYLIFFQLVKPYWTQRGEFHPGGVLFKPKEKQSKQGRKFQISKMFIAILFIYLWLFAKRFWKDFPKRFCKNKTSGASVVQNVKRKKAIHAYLMKVKIGLIPSNLCIALCKLVQFYTYIFALVCVGINHQKGGDWKGNRVKPFPNWFWWLKCPTQIIGLTSLL